MSEDRTRQWRRLFEKNCSGWDERNRRRYWNIPNDPEDIDEDELQAARDLIQEINGRPPVE